MATRTAAAKKASPRARASGPASAANPQKRGRARGQPARLAFESFAVEGALLSPEWLGKIATGKATGQGEVDYRVLAGLSFRDEIARYWKVARAHHSQFLQARAQARNISEGKSESAVDGDVAALAAANHIAHQAAVVFVTHLLKDVLGFSSLVTVAPVVDGERAFAIGHAALSGRVPVVIGSAPLGDKEDLDTPRDGFGDDDHKKSPFALLQEFLNVRDEALWGIACDGVTLRLARDNQSITRPAYVEVDLGALFGEERYDDFTLLWMLLHESRFGVVEQPVQECPLERWRAVGEEEGLRARDHLRDGVKEALEALGSGFLQHKDSTALRAAVDASGEGALDARGYYQELLRLVYRLMFLLAAEERGLLHPDTDSSSEAARSLYANGYSLKRLRERAARRNAWDRHHDAWESLRVVLAALHQGEPALALPALAGLFAPHQCKHLDAGRIENRHLLLAIFKLGWRKEGNTLVRINWRDLGTEELGSVYESLLELVPHYGPDRRTFAFAEDAATQKGNARKTSGSYYTPASLVAVLLDNGLEPVMDEACAKHPGDAQQQVDALLSLSVVDPACGSGHFLLAAAHRLAARVARLRSGQSPTRKEHQRALRDVVGACLYGVDLNPMAVELCKVALWMEAVEPGRPLTFLDAHIRHGNALLGTTPALMKEGIPDGAWEPIEGDDKKTASALKKRNKSEHQLAQFAFPVAAQEQAVVLNDATALEAADDDDLQQLTAKEQRFQALAHSPAYEHQKLVADAWCAAFVWPKQPGALAEAAPTQAVWSALAGGQPTSALTTKTTMELAEQYRFFHWHLAFPPVFARGGFDVVLGNPPWEKINFKDVEFFASRRAEIANASNKATRRQLIAKLERDGDPLFRQYAHERDQQDRISVFFRFSGRYPETGVSRINLYSVFAETGVRLLSPSARLGLVLASGIVTDENNSRLLSFLLKHKRLIAALDFENSCGIFPAVDSRFHFTLFCAGGACVEAPHPKFMFYAATVADLSSPERQFTLTAEDLNLLSPTSGTIPSFRTNQEVISAIALHRRAPPVTKHPRTDVWPGTTRTPFNMSNDAPNFVVSTEAKIVKDHLPLYESKFIHQFDHRFSSAEGNDHADSAADPRAVVTPNYWMPEELVRERFPGRWFLVYRKIARATDERTSIATIIPAYPCGDSLILIEDVTAASALIQTAEINSFARDFCARQKVSGTNFNHWIWNQVPLLPWKVYGEVPRWQDEEPKTWVSMRSLELTFTGWDLASFAHDVGYDGPPFRWDPARRFLLRCELDAAFFHLYGIARDDVDYIMDTFPIVKKNDEKAHGRYRTKETILEIYDAMAVAENSGVAYATRLDPPPADPRVAHPDRPR